MPAPNSTTPTSPSLSARPAPVTPPVDYAAVSALATHAETQLATWFDANPAPALEQLAIATQAIWRLAAVRKTLHLAANPALNPANLKKKSAPDPFARQLADSMLHLNLLLDLLHPTKTQKPASRPAASASSSLSPLRPLGLPSTPSIPPIPPLWPSPRAPRPLEPKRQSAAPASSAAESTRPISACPVLRAPLHTAQAAARQIDRLCQDSTTTPTPPSTPATAQPSADPPSESPSESSFVPPCSPWFAFSAMDFSEPIA